MAINTNLSQVFFSDAISNLNKPKIGVEADPFATQFAASMYDPDLTKPEGYDVPEIEQKEQVLDVPGGSEPLESDISEAVMLFPEEEKEKERKKLGTYVDPVAAQLRELQKFQGPTTKLSVTMPQHRGISLGDIPSASTFTGQADKGLEPVSLAGGDMADLPSDYVGETGFDTLADVAWEKGKDYYAQAKDYLFGPDAVQAQAGVGGYTTPSAALVQGGMDLATYAAPFATGLGTTATQASIGLSAAPAASLAGQGQFAAQAGTSTASTAGAYAGTAAKYLGHAASLYGIYKGLKSGTPEGQFDAAALTAGMTIPGAQVPVALMLAFKSLMGAWQSSKRQKPAFGGAEFKAEKNRLTATGGYGYNGYNKAAGQAMVGTISDYVNQYVKYFNLQFNGTRWANAIANDPRMNRYDTMNDSGYVDPSVITRKIFETDGLITGTPSVGGVPIASQQDYENKLTSFNQWYQKTALERGGLVDAESVGIDPNVLSNEWTKVPFASGKTVTPSEGGQYQTRTVGGGRGGVGGTTQTGYWKHSYHGSTWVPAPSNVSVEQTYSGPVATALNTWEEDATPYDMLYKNLVGMFPRGRGGTNYG